MKSLLSLFFFAGSALAQDPFLGGAVKAVEEGNKAVGRMGKNVCPLCEKKFHEANGVQKVPIKKNGDSRQNIPLFREESPLELTIQGNFPRVNESNADQNVPSAGKLMYKNSKGETVRLDVQLEARGGGRSWWCTFAPIKLKLPDDDELVKKTPFNHSHRNLKLVTHCNGKSFAPDHGDWNSVVATEYLLYKIVEASGLPYLGTRLVKATYLDRSGERFSEGLLLILENSEDLAQRMNMHEAGKFWDSTAEVPFSLSLRMIASESDHVFNEPKNSILLTADNLFSFAGAQVPYDFVLGPDDFPYSEGDFSHRKGWLVAQPWAKKYPEDVKKWIEVLKKNKSNVMGVFGRLPYPNRPEVNARIKKWLIEFYADIESY